MKYLIVLLFLVSCSSVVEKPEPTPVPPKPTLPKVDLRKEIFKIVADSSCSAYRWKNRGKAPISYMKGVALMYAKQTCGHGTNFIKSDKITGKNSIQSMKDSLEYYGLSGGELNTYTFLLGLGMMESSGKYCEGRDRSAKFVKDYEAEAGLYQTAYVSRLFNKELSPLYNRYKADQSQCELKLFSEGVTCSSYNAINHGKGPGVAWQDLTKKCPAFAVQWGAILIRSNYRHFGPIIKKQVEFKSQCKEMLSQVGELAKHNCGQL